MKAKSLRITIIGAGTVGKAIGKGFLKHGHTVYFNDKDSNVLFQLNKESLCGTRIITNADIYFICTHERYVEEVVKSLLDREGLIVIKSTTLPRTTETLMKKYNKHICHNPEFLRERCALEDFLSPDRIVIGECCKEHGDLLEALYTPFNAPIIRSKSEVSELAKLVSNAYLTASISFWNEIGKIAGYDISFKDVTQIVTLDKRIGKYGTRFLGSFKGKCLPKDLDSLIRFADMKESNPILLRVIKEVNNKLVEEENVSKD